MTDSNPLLVKAHAYFDHTEAPDITPGSESFWVTLQPHHPLSTSTHAAATVDNCLIWAPFTLQDTVLVTINQDNETQVVALLERAPHTSAVIIISDQQNPGQPINQETPAAAQAVTLARLIATTAETCNYRAEIFNSSLIAIQIPDTPNPNDAENALEELLDLIPTDSSAGLQINYYITHTPEDPNAISWLDTNLETRTIDQTYTGDPTKAWDGTLDPQFSAAAQTAQTEGDIAPHIDLEALAGIATQFWLTDQRIRDAISKNKHRNVAIYTYRVTAPPGTMLPPLNEPLFP